MKCKIIIITLSFLTLNTIQAQDTLFVYKQNALAFKISVREVDSICLNKMKLPLLNKVNTTKQLPKISTVQIDTCKATTTLKNKKNSYNHETVIYNSYIQRIV